MQIGFTGTHRGMTDSQKTAIKSLLTKLYAASYVIDREHNFRHGQCVGADVQSAAMAKEIGFRVIAFPGYPPDNPTNMSNRGGFDGNDEVMPEGAFLERDHLIVDASTTMIATPAQQHEVLRSGTWATVRYARKKGKIVIIVAPDGEMSV